MKKLNSKWAVWLVFGFAFMISFFHRYAIGVIADLLSTEIGLNPASLSLLASLYFYTYGIMQIPTGMMVDVHGPRKVVITGMSAVFLGSILFSLSSQLTMLYVARVLIGFGAATVFTSIFKIQSLWFKNKEFATIAGLTSVIGNMGAIFATSPFVYASSRIGWRASYMLVSIITLALIVVIILFIKDRPESPGMNELIELEDIDASSKGSVIIGFKEIAFNKYTWFNMIILFTVFGSYMSFSGLWGASYLTDTYGISIESASAYIMIFLGGTIIGSPLIGWISDRIGKRKLIIQISLFVLVSTWGVLIFTVSYIYSRLLMSLLLFLLGFTSISAILCFTNIKELNQKKYVGIATGFVNISPFFGTAILNSIVAYFLQLSTTANNYSVSVRVYFVASIIAFTTSFFLKDAKEEKYIEP